MPRLNNCHNIEILIVDDSRVEKCESSCGVDWSAAGSITLAKKQIKDRFGLRVRWKYLDLSASKGGRQVLELKREVEDKGLSLPVLVVNGEPRIAGQFDLRMVLDAIDAEIEIGRRREAKSL